MTNPLSRWRPAHLMVTWTAYWAGLAAATLGPAALAALRAVASSPPNTSSVNASIGNSLLRLSVSMNGATTYVTSFSVLRTALWIAVPPLLIFGGWLVTRRRAPAAAQEPERLTGGSPLVDVAERRAGAGAGVPRHRE